jgi:hypothetical protein
LLLLLVISLLLSFAGLAYILFLKVVFPSLVPFYGGAEQFTLNQANDYTWEIPWLANSRLHVSFQANATVQLCSDGNYLTDCTSYEFILGPSDYVLIGLKADSPVSGMFTAWQEPPVESQIMAMTLTLAGLAGIAASPLLNKRNQRRHSYRKQVKG